MRSVRILPVIVIALAVALILLPSQSQGAGIGVINVPPAFDTISIDTTDKQEYVIDIEIFDYNDASRIYMVMINFYITGDIVANFTFKQYEEPGKNSTLYTELSDQFRNEYGDYLKVDECMMEYIPVGWAPADWRMGIISA